MANSLSPDGLTVNAINGGQVGGNRNLIINGAMQVAQRGTSAVTSSGSYPVDRFSASYNVTGGAFSSVQSSVSPDDFVYSLKWETTTAATAGTNEVCTFGTKIEGYDINHFSWGTSAAKNCTVSFWVRSSLTGTYSFSIRNSDASRSYIAEYTINSADTWEQKEITISGPTDGTWNSTNGIGMILNWDLGSGSGRQGTAGSWLSSTNDFASTNQVNFANTSSATFYITGVQLEVGSTATEFEHRSFGDELARCMRYYEKGYDYDIAPGTSAAYDYNMPLTVRGQDEETSGQRYFIVPLRVEKRASPTVTYYDEAGNTGKCSTYNSAGTVTNNVSIGLSVTMKSRIGAGPSNSAIWGHGFFFTSDAEL